MVNQDSTGGTVEHLRQLAEKSVIEKNGKFAIQYDKQVEGLDLNKTYDTRDQAIEAMFNYLRTRNVRAA